jgi:hypothetical protein
MKPILSLVVVLAASGILQAQNPHVGLTLNITVPTGEFYEKTYPPTSQVDAPQVEGYDVGIGGQFTLSFPVQRNLAIRLGFGGMSSRGANTATGYDQIYLRHNMFSISGDLQLFFEDAYLHRGTYVFGGVSANFERFERSYDDYWDYRSDIDISRKSRTGGTLGLGHTFYTSSGFKFITEISYNTSLSGRDSNIDAWPKTEFLKIGLGFVF